MKKGVKSTDKVIGMGEEVAPKKTVVVNIRLFLNQGQEIRPDSDPKKIIHLNRRDVIPGLRYGLEGMRVGGQREIIISPHLAYGATGLPDLIPANAVLRAQIQLLEVRDSDVHKPEDYPPGKQLYIFSPGEAARDIPRWQLSLKENGDGGFFIVTPTSKTSWRRAIETQKSFKLEPRLALSIISSAINFPTQFPQDCIPHDNQWADAQEQCNSITRDLTTNTPCITISVIEQGDYITYFSTLETSTNLMRSAFFMEIQTAYRSGDPR